MTRRVYVGSSGPRSGVSMSMISDLHELESEASKIEPILSACSAVYKSGHLSASDFAGIFILSYLGLRRPKSWSNGRFKNSVSLSYHHDVAFINHLPLSTELSSIPGLLNILDREYVAKRMNCGVDDTDDSQRFSGITVLSIFDNLQLSRIKKNADNYVNRCLVCWAYNRRPCCLMFRIPTPLEVLQQQSEGSRVITMFLTKEQLGTRHVSMLYYMEGMQNHFKDSFEFLLHDMKHMENFVDTDTHDEQVGFFKCILRLSKYYLHQIDDQSDICKNSRVLSKNPAQDDLSAASCTAIFAANCADKCNLDTGSRSPWVCANYGDNQSNLTEKPNDLMENIAGLSIETELSSTYPQTKKYSSFPLKKFFTDLCGYDNQLWRELEYVISDM